MVVDGVTHAVFGAERKIDIPLEEFPSEAELEKMEAPLTDNGCQHGWFASCQGHLQLHYRAFLPKDDNLTQQQQQPRAIVTFMHGLQSHSGVAYVLRNGRKVNVALLTDHYVKQGFAVYAFDLMGHGYSEGDRHVMPNSDLLLQDYINFVSLVTSMHPAETPLFLAGESMGGNLTLQVGRYFQDHPEHRPRGFRGLVLFSPAIYPDTIYTPAQWYLKLFVTPFIPNWRPPSWIPSPVSPKNIWRDPERVQLGLQANSIAPQTKHPPYISLLTLTVLMRTVRETTIPGLTVPFCLVHGAKDGAIPIVGSEFLIQQSSTPSEDTAYKFYDEALHDLLAEPEAEDCMNFTSDWICKRIELLKDGGNN